MENVIPALRIVAEDLAIDLYAMTRFEEEMQHAADAASRSAILLGRSHHWDNADRTRRVIHRIIGPDTVDGDAVAARFFDLAKEIADVMHTLAPRNTEHDPDYLIRIRDRAVNVLDDKRADRVDQTPGPSPT